MEQNPPLRRVEVYVIAQYLEITPGVLRCRVGQLHPDSQFWIIEHAPQCIDKGPVEQFKAEREVCLGLARGAEDAEYAGVSLLAEFHFEIRGQ